VAPWDEPAIVGAGAAKRADSAAGGGFDRLAGPVRSDAERLRMR